VSLLARRRLLWLGLVLLLPVPFFGLESGLIPVVRMLMLGSLVTGVMLRDPDWMSQVFTAMFLGQGLVWVGLLYAVARIAARRLPERAPIAIVCVLALASLFPIYRTPFSTSGTRSSILQILD
jgi:hypothetical protein